MKVPMSRYARVFAERYGFAILPLRPMSKVPVERAWQNVDVRNPDEAEAYYTQHPDQNIGLNLGRSGMCSLDIDCSESFTAILDAFGVDPASLDNAPCIQGASKGRRYLFRVPQDAALDYAKLTWPTRDDQGKWYTVLELRAGSSRFDVLPPSVHPDTKKPYVWLTKPPASIEEWPTPPEWLLHIWSSWQTFRPQLLGVCPWYILPEPKAAPVRERVDGDKPSVIEDYLSKVSVTEALAKYGYKHVSGNRWLSPHSTTKLPGVVVTGDKCHIHHASDPLNDGLGTPVNAFDLFCYYEHGGDVRAAVKAAAPPPEPRPQVRELVRKREEPAQPPAEPVREEPKQEYRWPFRPLGYDGTNYYYLTRDTEQVYCISDSKHTSAGPMLSLADLDWWLNECPNSKGSAVDWTLAASMCMEACKRVGMFDARKIRGRGAWYDDGRAVLHLGGGLVVDGKPCDIIDHKTRYIYQRQPDIDNYADVEPADDETARRVMQLLMRLNWQSPVHASLLAGWVTLAPICGALKWRPHVWLTAQRGAGKSWTQENIVRPLLGSSVVVVQGNTTEAGIRQTLRQDARPVLFDEAEGESASDRKRVQGIIELARQSSSDSSAEIIKGTVSGNGMSFRMRSMFLLGSINVGLSQAADESRFSVIQLRAAPKTKEAQDAFVQLSKDVVEILTPETCAAIRARVYKLIPVIHTNAETMARAVAAKMGSRRIGDQVGTLLAGAIALWHSRVIDEEEATKWVDQIDLSEAQEAEQVSDEEMLLNHLLGAQIRYDSTEGRQMTRNVAELVEAAQSRANSLHVNLEPSGAIALLARHGFRVEEDGVWVANSHPEIARILRDTPWAGGHRRVLARLQGAECSETSIRFAGAKTRAVKVPLSLIQV